MKHKSIFTKLIFAIIGGFTLFTTQLSAQKYGYDVIINNQPTADQRSPRLTIAVNGWMFASYLKDDSLKIYKSTDNGINWTYFSFGNNIGAYDMVVCGTTIADLYLCLAVYVTNLKKVIVVKADVNTATAFGYSLNYPINGDYVPDIKIASDYKFPAYGASPYSLAVAFTIRGTYRDSVICWTSPDAGATFPIANKKTVDVSLFNYFRNISLCYGHSGVSGQYEKGRYFVAWEEIENTSDETGHIKFNRSDEYFNDVFLPWPTYIDSIYSTDAGNCKNPVVCCQADNAVNSSSGLTMMVAYDRKYTSTDYDIKYCFAYTFSPIIWTTVSIANTSAIETQADVVYDPVNHNFLATYYDQSTQKLPFRLKDFNLADPYNWLVYNEGYNDSPALSNPYPQIDINPLYTKVAFAWCKDGTPTTNGVIMYDGENSNNNINDLAASNELKLYPNPTSDFVNFKTTTSDHYIVTLYNITGQEVLINYFSGNTHLLNLQNIPKGYYLLKITSDNSSYSEKLIIQ